MAEWIDVSSSWLESIRYDSGDLYIKFKDGAICHYAGVSLDTWTDLLTAPSKGKFMHSSGLNKKKYTLL